MRVLSSVPDDGQDAAHRNLKENAMWASSTLLAGPENQEITKGKWREQ